MDAALSALRRAGLSEADAVQAFHTIGSFIFGSVMMETGEPFGGREPAASFPAGLDPRAPQRRLRAARSWPTATSTSSSSSAST